MIFSLSKTKAFGIAIGVLLIILLFLGWQYRSEVRKSAELLAGMQNAIKANHQQKETIKELRTERARLEKTLESRAAEQARIKSESARKIFNLERRLKGLRSEYESIDEFLSISVPADFVDQWMRKRSAGGDKDRDTAD